MVSFLLKIKSLDFMKKKEISQRSRLIMDVVVVLAIIVCCFLYVEHYNQIQNEASAILMNSVEDLNNSLANSAK
jgi:hypothetical protein